MVEGGSSVVSEVVFRLRGVEFEFEPVDGLITLRWFLTVPFSDFAHSAISISRSHGNGDWNLKVHGIDENLNYTHACAYTYIHTNKHFHKRIYRDPVILNRSDWVHRTKIKINPAQGVPSPLLASLAALASLALRTHFITVGCNPLWQ